MKIPPFKIVLSVGNVIPRGYGMAFRCWDRDAAVFFPIPVNWIIRWLRNLQFLITMTHRKNQFEQHTASIYRSGYNDGYSRGRRDERMERKKVNNETPGAVAQDCSSPDARV